MILLDLTKSSEVRKAGDRSNVSCVHILVNQITKTSYQIMVLDSKEWKILSFWRIRMDQIHNLISAAFRINLSFRKTFDSNSPVFLLFILLTLNFPFFQFLFKLHLKTLTFRFTIFIFDQFDYLYIKKKYLDLCHISIFLQSFHFLA